MANFSNCLQIVNNMPERDQEALLARIDELQAQGMTAKEAQLQAAIDVLAQVEREGQVRMSPERVTDTPAFKRWFGKSKIVNAEGGPLVVYHGTESEFDEFKPSRMGTFGPGIYFANTKESANEYGDGNRVVDAYVSLKNPWEVKARWGSRLADELEFDSPIVDALDELPMGRILIEEAARDGELSAFSYFGEDLQDYLKRLGYDGIVATYEDGSQEIVAFDSKQVKSASQNNGEFGDTPNIYKSVERPEFYSQLQRAIEGVPDRLANMGAMAWKQWIDSNGPKLGVKKEEIDWSGIKEYLDLQGKTKLSKDDLVRYLDDSGVQISEVMLGNDGGNAARLIRKQSNPRIEEIGNEWHITGDDGDIIESFDSEEAAERAMDVAIGGINGETKYGQYTLPGGENYRELLITLPGGVSGKELADLDERIQELEDDRDGAEYDERDEIDQRIAAVQAERKALLGNGYRSSHWDEPNILAHIRVNDRTDADGKRVLFVEEVQSDWGQEGKKTGFASKAVSAERVGDVKRIPGNGLRDRYEQQWKITMQDGSVQERSLPDGVDPLLGSGNKEGPPAAPFVTKTEGWLNLALKRIAMMAVEGGYDKVAFVNGEQSADRYDLSKQIQSIAYSPEEKLLDAWDKDRRKVMRREITDESQIEDYVGKEVAKRLLATKPVMGKHLLDGEDIKVGGEGMKTFYDKIVPQALNKLLPKLGGEKLGAVTIGGNDKLRKVRDDDGTYALEEKRFDEYDEPYWEAIAFGLTEQRAAEVLQEDKRSQQPGFDVTDKMRETVGQGVALFSPERFVEAEESDLFQKRTAKDVGLISDADAMAALKTDATSVRIMDKGYKVKPGELVGARLNLNVLKNTKVPVMTLHKATNTEGYKNNRGFYRGEAVQYQPAVTLRNAYFNVDQTGRENIATGTQNKFPMASVDGEFVDAKPNFDGVEVSFNPMRVHLFVDANGFPMRSAEEISMFANRAYARGKIEYYTKETAPKRKGDAPSEVKLSTERTDTPEFKRWFGDSKVVDADGKPLVVYHGTGNSFGKFARGAYTEREGFYFSSDPKFASDFAENAADGIAYEDDEEAQGPSVMPAYLSIQNPVDVRDGWPADVAEKLDDVINHEWLTTLPPSDFWLAMDGSDGAAIKSKLESLGYDGLIASEIGAPVYVAFRPEQIKSAIGNNGQFDATNPDIRKSADRPYFDDLSKLKVSTNYQLGDLLKTSKKLSWWDKSIGTQYNLAQKHPQFKRVFDAVQRFIGDVSAYATHAADLAPNFLPKLESWKDIAKSPLSAADVKALRDPIFGGTLKYTRDENGELIETEDVSTAGVVFTNEELRTNFGLDDRQIGLYREFRRATNKSLSDLAVSDMLRYLGTDGEGVRQRALDAKNLDGALDAMVAHLDQMIEQNPKRAEVLENAKKAIKEKAGQAIGLMARGYAPLSRFGQYTVDVVDANGERLYFSMFENERDANKMAREMQEQYPDATVQTGTMSQESYKLFSGVTPETLALFGESLGLEESSDDAKSQIFQEYLKAAKTNRSAMKRLIQRKGIDGFSEDAGRVLAGFVYSNARQISTNLHAGEIGRSAAAVTDGDVKDAAIRLMEYVQNPREEAQALRGLMFTQFIGGSIASAMVNLTQPFTMTLPYLSQFAGAIGAGKLMTDAVKLASRGVRNDDELAAALKRGEDEGTVSPQEVHQLMAQAQGKGSLQSGDGTRVGDAAAKVNNGLAKLGLGWGKVFSAAEQFNRRVTFIAAYKMARDKGMADPYAFAVQAISETQGVYNKGNKPAWARGAVGGTLFTFKQYSIGYVEFLRRMWGNGPEGKKAVGLALGVLFLMSGLGGMPGADDLDDVIDGFLQRVLGRSFDTKQAKKEFFASILGQSGAEFVMSGISGIPGMPIDVANRMGLGNLIPGTGLLTKKRDYSRDYLEIAGPAGTLFTNAGLSVAALASGDVRKAAEVLSPVAIQNALKAKDMAEMGFYRDMKGRKVIDTDAYDVVIKAMGFQPRAVAQVQEATGTQANLIAQNKLRETEIADKWAAGRIEKDPAKVEEAKQMLADWNRNNPESKISIDANQINKRVQEANKTKAARISATAPKEIRGAVKKELERVD